MIVKSRSIKISQSVHVFMRSSHIDGTRLPRNIHEHIFMVMSVPMNKCAFCGLLCKNLCKFPSSLLIIKSIILRCGHVAKECGSHGFFLLFVCYNDGISVRIESKQNYECISLWHTTESNPKYEQRDLARVSQLQIVGTKCDIFYSNELFRRERESKKKTTYSMNRFVDAMVAPRFALRLFNLELFRGAKLQRLQLCKNLSLRSVAIQRTKCLSVASWIQNTKNIIRWVSVWMCLWKWMRFQTFQFTHNFNIFVLLVAHRATKWLTKLMW